MEEQTVEEQTIHNAVCLGLISGGGYVDSAVWSVQWSVLKMGWFQIEES